MDNKIVRQAVIEHLGYLPEDFVRAVLDVVDRYLYKYRHAIHEFLLKKARKAPKGVIDEGMGRLALILNSLTDTYLGKSYQRAVEDVFDIPKELILDGWFRLEHAEGIDFSNASELTTPSIEDDPVRKLLGDVFRAALVAVEKQRRLTQRKKALNELQQLQARLKSAEPDVTPTCLELTSIVEQTNQVMHKIGQVQVSLPPSLEPSYRDLCIERLVAAAIEKTKVAPYATWPVSGEQLANAQAFHKAVSLL